MYKMMKNLFTLAIMAFMAIFISCSDDDNTDDPRSFAVTVTSGGNGKASADVPTAEPGRTVTLTAEPDEGYKFASWFVESGNITLSGLAENPATFTMPATDVKIVASFSELAAEPQAITVTAEEGGKVAYEPKEATPGTIVKIAAEPDKGYRFVGWKVEKGGVKIIETENPLEAGFVMGDEEVVIVAQFEVGVYAITIDGDLENGKVEVKDNLENATEGTIITLTAIPDAGYKFAGWNLGAYALSEDVRKNNPLVIKMPANDLQISAQFSVPIEDVLTVIDDPAFKAYALYRMDHAQTVVVKSEYVVNGELSVETEEIETPVWDTDGDGKLSEDEAAAIRAIDVSKEVLESLDGFNWDGTAIQSLNCKGYFLGLEVLKASHQKITDLHANEFRALKVLVCDNNGLQTIDVTKCAALTMLFVEQNELTALDITKNRELHSVSCYDNHIEELNIGSMKFRKDNSYFLRCGRQTDTAGTEISLILRGMRSNQVSYWNDVLANDDSPERQYNRRIGVVY